MLIICLITFQLLPSYKKFSFIGKFDNIKGIIYLLSLDPSIYMRTESSVINLDVGKMINWPHVGSMFGSCRKQIWIWEMNAQFSFQDSYQLCINSMMMQLKITTKDREDSNM